MFAPKGWISVHDAFKFINENITLILERNGEEFFGDEAFEVTWDLLSEVKEAELLLPSGVTVPLSLRVFETVNECDDENDYLCLYHGTLGSSNAPFQNIPEKDFERDFSRKFGPFGNCPILIPRKDFDDFLELKNGEFSKSDEVDIGDEKTDNSPKATAKRILEAFGNGDATSKQSIKDLVAPTQSARKFALAWALAAMENPSLSRPGRKTK